MRKTYGRVLHWLIAPALEQAEREKHPQLHLDEAYLSVIRNATRSSKFVTMRWILSDVLKLPVTQWTVAEQRRAGRALKFLGWERKFKVLPSDGFREWYYERPNAGGQEQ